MNDILKLDKKCSMPHLIVGDTVRLNSGEVAIITAANVTINGCSIEWSGKLPEVIRHGWMPTYAVTSKNWKGAWYEASDFKEVLSLSLLRKEYGFPTYD